MWELSTRGNWVLVATERKTIVRTYTPNDPKVEYKYDEISPIYVEITKPAVLIGAFSETAKPHWFLGGIVSQYLFISPSTYLGFMSGVKAEKVINIGLNRLNFIEFKTYNLNSYVLEIKIPYWLEDIYIEVWEYQGYEAPNFINADLEAIKEDLERIEAKIDAVENYGI
jgi:hypothetical protein